jgi:hypothetical protein
MKDPAVALEIVEARHNAGLILHIESDSGSIANYLGIQIQEEDDGTLLLTQSGLIDRIQEAIDLKNANPKDTSYGSCRSEQTITLIQRQVQLLFSHWYDDVSHLKYTTRLCLCDSQCPQFSHDPQEAHASALKRLARYLKKTCLDGLCLQLHQSNKQATLDLWCDADFAGLLGKEDPQDPSCVQS